MSDILTKDQKDEIKSQLTFVGKDLAKEFAIKLKDHISADKSERVEELIRDIAAVKTQAMLASEENAPLYMELLEDKLASLNHVLDSERILAEREFKAVFVTAAKALLETFGSVGAELVKSAVKGAVSGAVGSALGGLGETIVEKAVDKLGDSLSPS